jgi:type IV secretion system protein VirD4
MRKDKALPFRVAFTLIVAVLDFVIIPQLLMVPIQLKQGAPTQLQITAAGWITALPLVKNVWLWLQPIAVAAVVWLWLTGRSLVNVNFNADIPQPAGHGQHGTARWQTEKEIDRNFSVHSFKKEADQCEEEL